MTICRNCHCPRRPEETGNVSLGRNEVGAAGQQGPPTPAALPEGVAQRSILLLPEGRMTQVRLAPDAPWRFCLCEHGIPGVIPPCLFSPPWSSLPRGRLVLLFLSSSPSRLPPVSSSPTPTPPPTTPSCPLVPNLAHPLPPSPHPASFLILPLAQPAFL